MYKRHETGIKVVIKILQGSAVILTQIVFGGLTSIYPPVAKILRRVGDKNYESWLCSAKSLQ